MSGSRTMAQMWRQVDHLKDVIRRQHDKAEKRNAEIKALKAENAKLREERDHWHVEQVHAYGNWEDAHKHAIELEKQNAKLRELLQRALTSHNKMCTNRGTCLECLLFNAKPFEPACPIVSVTRDARELGIEVS